MVETLKCGDTVVVKLRDAAIVASYEAYDEKMVFEIIAVNYQGWHIYVPPYIFVKNTVPITQKNYKSIGVQAKFIGSDALFITSSFIVKVEQTLMGLFCNRCSEYFEYAEANQEHGIFLCWSCINYPYYH